MEKPPSHSAPRLAVGLQPPVVTVRELEAIPPAHDPWAILERLPQGWDDLLRERKAAPSGKTRTLAFHFEGGRSLAAAVDILVCRHDLFLNYEDAPWIANQDTEEQPVQARSETSADVGAPSKPPVRVRIPASERLDFEYLEDPETQLPVDAYGLIEGLVDAHRQQGGHGRFRVERLNDGIASIVPSEALGENGEWLAIEPILSRRITVRPERRSVGEFFDRVLDELNKESPYRIGYGWSPLNAFNQTAVDFGAHDEPARDVLLRALRALPYRYYMVTNFDPMRRSYFLSVRNASGPSDGAVPTGRVGGDQPSDAGASRCE